MSYCFLFFFSEQNLCTRFLGNHSTDLNHLFRVDWKWSEFIFCLHYFCRSHAPTIYRWFVAFTTHASSRKLSKIWIWNFRIGRPYSEVVPICFCFLLYVSGAILIKSSLWLENVVRIFFLFFVHKNSKGLLDRNSWNF